MEITAIKKVIEQVDKNKKVALVTVIRESGTSPAKQGLSMALLDDKSIYGTIGGGSVEYNIVDVAYQQLLKGKDANYIYQGENAEVEVFIKIFNNREKVLIIGGGHVGYEIYKIAELQKFYTVIFDSREGIANRERFKYADEIYCGDLEELLKNYNIDDKSYVVSCAPTHQQDEIAMKTCIDRGAKYIGMLGSRKKIKTIKENLSKQGVSKESLDEIYSPIGINTGGDSVHEIAFGIFGEILAVKNNCKINHMKDIKR